MCLKHGERYQRTKENKCPHSLFDVAAHQLRAINLRFDSFTIYNPGITGCIMISALGAFFSYLFFVMFTCSFLGQVRTVLSPLVLTFIRCLELNGHKMLERVDETCSRRIMIMSSPVSKVVRNVFRLLNGPRSVLLARFWRFECWRFLWNFLKNLFLLYYRCNRWVIAPVIEQVMH